MKSLVIVLAVVIGISLVGNGLQYQQSQIVRDEMAQMESDLQSVRAQFKESQSQFETMAQQQEAAAKASQPALLTIAEFKVQMNLPAGLGDTVYVPVKNDPDTVKLSSKTLQAVDSSCRASSAALGSIVRYPKGKFPRTGVQKLKTIGSYEFGLKAPGDNCSAVQQVQKLQADQVTVLKQAAQSLAPL